MLVASTDHRRALVGRALEGDEAAVRGLIDLLTPVVQARVARVLLRHRPAGGRPIRELVEDLTQESLLTLFADSGKVLRRWDPQQGLSLENFVGLVARRQALSTVRTGRRNPWREDPTLDESLERPAPGEDPERLTASRQQLRRLLERVQEELSPLGWQLFELLFLKEMEVTEVQEITSMSSAAIYAWRSRLRRLARRLEKELVSERRPPPRIHIMDGTQ